MTTQNPYIDLLKQMVLDYANNYPVRIYLIGSRARNDARKTSDVDIAILPLEPLPKNFIIQLRDILEESTIPYAVDIVDLSQCTEEQKKKFLNKAIIWKD
jgi:predicted nucleotidyltransferase